MFEGLFSQCAQGVGGEFKLGVFHLEELLILLDEGVFGLGEDIDKGGLIKGRQGGNYRDPPDELGNHTELDDVLGNDLLKDVCQLRFFIRQGRQFRAEANHLFAKAFLDDVVEADEGAATNEQDVGSVHLNVGLFGVLAASLRGDIGYCAFKHFQKRLLDAFAGDVAGDGDILIGLADFVDFIDVNDTTLGGFEVEVGVLQEAEQEVFDVFADVAGLGDGGRVADCEGDIEEAGERLGEKRFA